MNSDHENKCTFPSSTLKVEDNNVPLFLGSDIICGRYELFDIFWHERGVSGIFMKLHKDKEPISPSNDVWLKK